MSRKFSPRSPTSHTVRVSGCRTRSRQSLPIADPLSMVGEVDHRFLCSEVVNLHAEGAAMPLREFPAILEEIAPHSACLQFEEPIPVQTTVRFLDAESSEGSVLTGTIVECRHHMDLGYFAEVRFIPGCTWSIERFRPAHLFDPVDLMASRAAASA